MYSKEESTYYVERLCRTTASIKWCICIMYGFTLVLGFEIGWPPRSMGHRPPWKLTSHGLIWNAFILQSFYDGYVFRSIFSFCKLLTSKDVHRGCHVVQEGQGMLKKQKLIQNRAKPWSKIDLFVNFWGCPRHISDIT